VIYINPQEIDYIEEMGLLFETSGASRTLGRVFGYLLISEKPKTLDEIARDLLFSKATASLTMRQGLLIHFFEKVSVSGDRKDFYRVSTIAWTDAQAKKIRTLDAWEKLIRQGLAAVSPHNTAAVENLNGMKDYFDFINWYLSDFPQMYIKWKNGTINKNINKPGANSYGQKHFDEN